MKVADSYEVLESVVVAVDPVVDVFAGALVFDGERHVLTETAPGSGSHLCVSALRTRGQPTRSWRRSFRAVLPSARP